MSEFILQSIRIWVAATNPDHPLSSSDQGKARNLVSYALTGAVEPFMRIMMGELQEALKCAAVAE